jgi:multidrug efflux pump subunit AcrA (membrane-fusion protein)
MSTPINPANQQSGTSPATDGAATLAAASNLRRKRLSDRAKDSKSAVQNILSLDNLQTHLQGLVTKFESNEQFIQQLLKTTAQFTNALWCGHFVADLGNQIECTAEHNSLANQNLGISRSSLLPTVASALGEGKIKVSLDSSMTVIAAPALSMNDGESRTNGCFGVALNLANAPVEPFLLITQMIANQLGRQLERVEEDKIDWRVKSTAAMIELSSMIVESPSTRAATILAANEVATFLDASVVAIGFCPTRNSGLSHRKVTLQSISGNAQVDLGGKQASLIQRALNETLVRDSTTTLPAIEGDDRSMKLAHQRLIQSYPNSRIVSAPLKTRAGKTMGAWVGVLPDRVDQHDRATRFFNTTGPHLADALLANQNATAGVLSRIKQQSLRFAGGKVGRLVAAAGLLLALAMMIPIPHRVACDCELQPSVRRFAVAPLDGILLESFVSTGDLVSKGQVIAQMDDRELILELADLVAERDTATKKRDVSRSSGDAAATQIAELEVQQLNARIELLKFKKDSLRIASPIDGIVLQSDLEDAQGAPLRTGNVLTEIAPLDSLRLELSVFEPDVSYIQPQQSATIVLDGAPFDTLTGKIELIRPESEIRNNRNVFVSEIGIDNQDQLLRPGMQGQAKIAAGNKSLGWILFHRPIERVFSIFR